MENVKNDTRDRELIITRKINAPVELVWEVWTKPEHIANWWGPEGSPIRSRKWKSDRAVYGN